MPALPGVRRLPFQDLAYEAQLESKAAQVRDALTRIGGIAELPLEEIVPAESVFNYRNKLEYSFTATPDGPSLGFHRAGRWDEVLDIEQCWLTTDLGNEVRLAAREWAREAGLAAYDQADQTGYLRHLVYREGRNTGQVLVQLVTAPGPLHDADGLVAALRRFPEVRSIHHAVNDTAGRGDEPPDHAAVGRGGDRGGVARAQRFRVRPNAFLQTNTAHGGAALRPRTSSRRA